MGFPVWSQLLSRPTVTVADGLRFGDSTFLRGHRLPVTCIALPGPNLVDGTVGGNARKVHVYTGGKDCCIIRWDLETGGKDIFEGRRNCFQGALKKSGDESSSRCGGHFRAVLDICVAEDERVFFSAGADHTVRAWDPRASNTRYGSWSNWRSLRTLVKRQMSALQYADWRIGCRGFYSFHSSPAAVLLQVHF